MTQGPPIEALATPGGTSDAGFRPELVSVAPRVTVFHDRALARAGLVALLGEHGFDVSASPPPSAETPLAGGADVVLLASGGPSAATAQRLGYEGETPVLMMLEGPPDGDMLLAVTASGASGCVCHECPPERVVRALRAVAAGGTFFECTHEPTGPVVAGTEEIALALCISPHTVRTHVRNIKRKLDARTCAQAVAMAITLRLVDPPRQSQLGRLPGSRA